MVHMQCTELYYLLLASVWRCIRLNHIYGDMDMLKIWALLFICFIRRRTRTESLNHNTQLELNLLRLRVHVVFEEGLSAILASAAVDILMAFFKSKIYFFPCWVSRKLIN